MLQNIYNVVLMYSGINDVDLEQLHINFAYIKCLKCNDIMLVVTWDVAIATISAKFFFL